MRAAKIQLTLFSLTLLLLVAVLSPTSLNFGSEQQVEPSSQTAAQSLPSAPSSHALPPARALPLPPRSAGKRATPPATRRQARPLRAREVVRVPSGAAGQRVRARVRRAGLQLRPIPYLPGRFRLEGGEARPAGVPGAQAGVIHADAYQPGKAGWPARFTDPQAEESVLHVEPAWGLFNAWKRAPKLGEGVLVAVLDSGLSLDHPEFAGRIWDNPQDPRDGVDNDHNGYVDDSQGVNFASGNGDPTDLSGHGTAVSGILGANLSNGVGGAGVAPRVTLMPIRVLDQNKQGSTLWMEQGIHYAADHGARIISISMNSSQASASTDQAILYAQSRGAVVVASAGNKEANLDSASSYPCQAPLPAMVCVSALSGPGKRASYSNYGRGVDLAAPGDNLTTDLAGGQEHSVHRNLGRRPGGLGRARALSLCTPARERTERGTETTGLGLSRRAGRAARRAGHRRAAGGAPAPALRSRSDSAYSSEGLSPA